MTDDAKKVFLSYRRSRANYFARTIFAYLKDHGFDVFMDVESLDSGRFPEQILHQIEARPHFIIALTPGSLDRMIDESDWLRRELEHAIAEDRNVVPVLGQGFRFDGEAERKTLSRLPTELAKLSDFQAVPVYDEYVDVALERLSTRYLKRKVDAAIKPTPSGDVDWVRALQVEATKFSQPSTSTFASSTLLAPKLKLGLILGARRGNALVTLPTSGETLGTSTRRLTWSKVPGAAGYVLERSYSEDFAEPYPAFEGDETSHEVFDMPAISLARWFRVRAKALLGADGPWSNVVRVDPASTLRSRKLDAPVLEIGPSLRSALLGNRGGSGVLGFTRLSWNEIAGASGYLLQQSVSGSFHSPTEVYKGDETEYETFGVGRYRVRAIGAPLVADSDWSNVAP